MNRRALFASVAASLALGGCSKLKKLTGQSNDTVLPGQREDILPPEQYTAKSADTAPPSGQAPAPPAAKTGASDGQACDPEVDPDCAPPAAEDTGGVFNDG
jgi:hypothetical protein